mmetsp:Transcript_17715/g.37937  ORF Transcript_17715/g.37937 Transcript_17715/m.37937 type:complete len:293 (+) Transcript_17715:632-1510(+)
MHQRPRSQLRLRLQRHQHPRPRKQLPSRNPSQRQPRRQHQRHLPPQSHQLRSRQQKQRSPTWNCPVALLASHRQRLGFTGTRAVGWGLLAALRTANTSSAASAGANLSMQRSLVPRPPAASKMSRSCSTTGTKTARAACSAAGRMGCTRSADGVGRRHTLPSSAQQTLADEPAPQPHLEWQAALAISPTSPPYLTTGTRTAPWANLGAWQMASTRNAASATTVPSSPSPAPTLSLLPRTGVISPRIANLRTSTIGTRHASWALWVAGRTTSTPNVASAEALGCTEMCLAQLT